MTTEEFKDQGQADHIAEQQSALVDYHPKSKAPFRLETLIPRNMAFEVQKALNRVVQHYGNVDNYVRDHLKYPAVEELWKGLAAEQVDSLALYLSQFDRKQGMIVADQTGIGKGRQAAAVIRHAVMNGYLPVFFTRKPDLFTDMYRDLKNIGFADIHPYIVNTTNNARIKDAEGVIVFNPLSSEEQYEELVMEREIETTSSEAMKLYRRNRLKLPDPEQEPTLTLADPVDYLPEGYDMIFCTYSQVQAAHYYKREWLKNLVLRGVEGSKKNKKVVFILDESHMAGGYDSIIGEWVRSVLPKARACCFLSATFAKYPDVMPLYATKTAFREANMTNDIFVSAMRRGGLALQEIAASDLAVSGQLIRRQRSNEGIAVFYHHLDQEPQRSLNRDRVDRLIRIMNQIVAFEAEYATPIMVALHAKAKEAGEQLKKPPKELGVKQSPYFSRVFNIVDQMLFALKVEEVAALAIRLLNENKKVVIAFKSTMGAFLKDLNLVSGDVVQPGQMDFVLTLLKGLASVLGYHYTDIYNAKSHRELPLEEFSPDGLHRYQEIEAAIWDESTGLSISPIDQLIQIIESTEKPSGIGGHEGDYYRVAEVTGRNQRIDLSGDEPIIESFKTDTEKYFRLFNRGDYDVLLINQSGSTGSSAHASVDFKDQRQRAMIIHQFELDINTEMQKRGRVNRTGQVVKPEYHYITTDIPTEQRLLTMLKGKLKSLDANTTGSQNTNDDTLRSPDFMNKYGDEVAFEWAGEAANEAWVQKMGWPTYYVTKEGVREQKDSKAGAIRQVTGRAGLLSVAQQDALYDELLQRYEDLINWEKQRGTYDLETEFLKLDADVKKRFLYQQGKGGVTPFGKDTVRDECIVNNLQRPLTKDEIDAIVVKTLGGQSPTQLLNTQVRKVEEDYPPLMEQYREDRQQVIDLLSSELAALPPEGSADSDKKNDKISRQRQLKEEAIRQKIGDLESNLKKLENIRKTILSVIQYWKVGDVVKVPMGYFDEDAWGIYLGVEMSKGGNPYAPSKISLKFAVADFRRILKFNLADGQRSAINDIFTASKDIKQDEVKMVNSEWNEMIKTASQKREERHILTENIIGASRMINGHNKLIKYNTKEGEIKNGILLRREKKKSVIPALTSMSGALKELRALETDDILSDHQNRIRFKRIGQNDFQVLITKKDNYKLYSDDELRELIDRSKGQSEDELANFVQNAGDMTAPLQLSNLEAFLERLDSLGLRRLTEARELEEWEIENAEDWHAKTTHDAEYAYKLTRPYGQGSNPTTDFIEYQEPSSEHLYGLVTYGRPLTDKERYNYGLIPLFKAVEEPYQSWKIYINQYPELKEELLKEVNEAKRQPLSQAVMSLGHFMTNHPHEDGNPEYIFGQYGVAALGRAAYEDTIGPISELQEVIAQLQIELEAV